MAMMTVKARRNLDCCPQEVVHLRKQLDDLLSFALCLRICIVRITAADKRGYIDNQEEWSQMRTISSSRLRTAGVVLSAAIFLASSALALADSAESSTITVAPVKNADEKKTSIEEILHWSKPISEGPDQIFYFAEAMSGKTLKPETYDLLRGVNEVTIDKDNIIFHRVDKEELKLGSDTEHGGKFFDDWEKSKVNLQIKFGPAGKEFLDSIASVHVNGDRIEVVRKGAQDTSVDMGQRKLHKAFDLRGLRFRQMSMAVDTSGKHPALKDIEGVTAVINAPGFNFPVDIKEFSKWRLEKENDIRVGVRNPVPSAVRSLFFLPSILRFHFLLPRKD
jgi:hypothetical protein